MENHNIDPLPLNFPSYKQNPNEIISIPNDILFPSELNQHLKQEIEYLTQQNCMLKKIVNDLEENLQSTKQELESSKQQSVDTEYVPVSEITRSKIVELSKKLREKSSEVVHFKNKCAKLDQTLSEIKLQENERLANSTIEEKIIPKPPESELKILNDKIASLNCKLFEEKNQNLCLKNDLKLATKLLQDEIGEGFESLSQIFNNPHWRGRAQIINDLQHKYNEVKEKLKAYQDKEGNKSCEIATKKMYIEKKLDKLTKEVDTLRNDNEALTKKLDNTRQKYKSIDSECTGWKIKYSTILEQFERDHSLIKTLTEQTTTNKSQQNEIIKRKDRQIEKMQRESKELKLALKQIECDVENLKKQIIEKETELENAKKTPTKLDNGIKQNVNYSHLSAERIRLVELTKVLSDRVQQERDKKVHFEGLYRAERQKAAKLESNLARARLDNDEKGSYTSLMLNRPSLENHCEFKLELAQEKIKALQTRLQLEKNERDMDLQEFSKIMQNYQ